MSYESAIHGTDQFLGLVFVPVALHELKLHLVLLSLEHSHQSCLYRLNNNQCEIIDLSVLNTTDLVCNLAKYLRSSEIT